MVVRFIEWNPTSGLEERSSKESADTKLEKKKQDIVVHPDGMLWGKEESQEKKGE